MADNPIKQSLNGLEFQYDFAHTESWGGMGGGFILSLSVGSSLKKFDDEDYWAIHRQVEEIEKILRGRIYKADPAAQQTAFKEKAELLSCFEQALPIYVEPVQNEYHRTGDPYGDMHPWFIVTTARGRIKVGWRKRVINLDWSASEIEAKAEDLFGAENVTKGIATSIATVMILSGIMSKS